MGSTARAVLIFILLSASLHAREILTNSVHVIEPPPWLTEGMVEKATGPVQEFLQWNLRRLKVYWHLSDATFEPIHNAGPTIHALYRRSDGTIHIGPKVNAQNFDPIFAHELVHAIFHQKYKSAIPLWLEEGLANYLGKTSKVDYAWLNTQPFQDVKQMTHPRGEALGLKYHYQTSTALTEMIVAKCNLHDLLHLSVGRSLEKYLSTYCEIADINTSYREWVKTKSNVPAEKPKRWWENRIPKQRPTPAKKK